VFGPIDRFDRRLGWLIGAINGLRVRIVFAPILVRTATYAKRRIA
jgi:hypothetical protein